MACMLGPDVSLGLSKSSCWTCTGKHWLGGGLWLVGQTGEMKSCHTGELGVPGAVVAPLHHRRCYTRWDSHTIVWGEKCGVHSPVIYAITVDPKQGCHFGEPLKWMGIVLICFSGTQTKFLVMVFLVLEVFVLGCRHYDELGRLIPPGCLWVAEHEGGLAWWFSNKLFDVCVSVNKQVWADQRWRELTWWGSLKTGWVRQKMRNFVRKWSGSFDKSESRGFASVLMNFVT